jgi:hypothetical protein
MKRPKKLFDDPGREHGTVILNWVGTPEREFTWYGQAFHDAGKALANELREDPRFGLHGYPPDSFKALPVLFNYRHAMELYLKGIILAGADILPVKRQPEIDMNAVMKTHSLRQLLRDVERIFAAFGWHWNLDLPEFESLTDFRAIIDELETVDAQSYAFRYPTGKDGRRAPLESHFRFNLFTFTDMLDPVYELLDGAAYGAHEELQFIYEQMAAAREYAYENGNFDPPEYDYSDYDPGDYDPE